MPHHALTDPTALTTAALQREIQATRDLANTHVAHVQELITTRLDAMDKAIDLLAQYPTRMDEKVNGLREYIESIINGMKMQRDEQFRAIDQRFHERDLRADQRIEMSEKALNAALTSAKEAVAEHNQSSALAISKSEVATDKRMLQMELLIGSKAEALDTKISSNSDRLTRIEGRDVGAANARTTSLQGISVLVAVIMGLLAVGTMIVSVVIYMSRP